ncbi:hypothetical protein N7470_007887 [Penicillium chermesinum]|nr:hypothetical protein N7470_007887 [Penicillium chermesinum]
MDLMDLDDPLRRRQPFSDASSRVNYSKSPRVETPRVRVEEVDQLKTPDRMSFVTTPTTREKENQRLSVNTDFQCESARSSVMSAASLLSNKGKRKTHVGPWQLGRTLGKGATGRVRLAKHAVTGQTAAIKIVSKKSAAMVQSESIAAMDRNVSNFSGFSTARQMPSGIEREVVIMKLIEHPNVISLYDVWENRGELYLVLEYVEGGELFDYVSQKGPLHEQEAVRIFRQIIAGLGYCHRFNICHRDLKPENILLDGKNNVKLADFGMAALQPAGHWLNTSCGSPHYAAPEIIYGRKYRGDRADMWSCGIILYALLTGFLPFDGGDLPNTLRLVKKGDYMIPSELSDEAADLITRILQKRPEDRISMQSIWLHPLLKKYEKLHNAMADHPMGPAPPLSVKDCGELISSRQDVDMDILRNLQTLWHDVKPDVLIDRLMCIEPTHERMFYNALVKFRDEQLENYQGQSLDYSASDYHHISRPSGRRGRGHNFGTSSKRRNHLSIVRDLHSRISIAQEPKSCASVESYDPFRSPKTHGSAAEAKYAQVTIHRVQPETVEEKDGSPAVKPPPSIVEEAEPEDDNAASDSPFTVLQKRKHKPNSMKSFHSSKVPLSSSKPRGLSTHSASYRRNVSFHHARNRSQGSTKPKKRKIVPNQRSDLKRSPSACSLQMIADGIIPIEMPSSPPLPAQPTVVRQEDARKVSNELRQICEEAFNGSSVTTMRTTSTATDAGYETPTTPVSIGSPNNAPQTQAVPKPAASTAKDPARPYSIEELTETRRKLAEHSKGRNDNVPTYLSGVIGHLDRLIEEDHAQRRNQLLKNNQDTHADPFISIAHESSLPAISEEAVPEPVLEGASPKPKSRLRGLNRNHDGKATIRMVPHSSLHSMEEVKPLMIRKKNPDDSSMASNLAAASSMAGTSRQTRNPSNLAPIDEIPGSPKKGEKVPDNKKWSWFKHRSQLSDSAPGFPSQENQTRIASNDTVIVRPPQELQASPTRDDEHRVPTRKSSMERFKGGFLKLMPKKTNKPAPSAGPGIGTSTPFSCFYLPLRQIQGPSGEQTGQDLLCKGMLDTDSSFEAHDQNNPFTNKRRSLANQNWFARVFQIKPACRVIALNTSKVKGRKEVYRLLRDWEDYGMEDVRMDKGNSIVHGRVGEVNCKSPYLSSLIKCILDQQPPKVLRLREVEFTAEFYTVLEHGRQANLSLVRFKQERGAASSFNKVVDTVHMMLRSRGLVVEDALRARKMARVLDTIPNA